jgi:hypothetical protein
MDTGGLRRDLWELLSEREEARWAHALGRTPSLSLRPVFAAHRAAWSPDSFQALHERLASPKTNAEEKPGLHALLRGVAKALRDSLRAGADEEISTLGHREAIGRIAASAFTEERRLLAQTLVGAVRVRRGPYAERLLAELELPQRLGRDRLSTVREARDEKSVTSLEACAAFVRQTDDAYRDVLGHMLRRVDPTLRPHPRGQAGWQDLAHAATTPWLPHLGGSQVLRGFSDGLVRWGFLPSAEGRVSLEQKEGRYPAGEVFALRPPSFVGLLVAEDARGTADARTLLGAYGRALGWGLLPQDGSVETVLLVEPALTALGGLFGGLLTIEAFHRRVLEAPRAVAKEAARAAALLELAAVRYSCERRLTAQELEVNGPTQSVADAHAERTASALGVAIPSVALDVAPPSVLWPEEELDGYARTEVLRDTAEARFQEDYFRNPAAADWLKAAFQRRGLPETSPDLAEALKRIAKRLVSVLAA